MTVVGTRPEIIRLSMVLKSLDKSEAIEHTIVHTGQNYDYELNQIFFEDLGLRKPDYFLEAAGKKQIRMAETEKYPHVTFFFSGGREEPFVGESRILCPSPKVATYDLKPEMSAYELKDALVPELFKKEANFIRWASPPDKVEEDCPSCT